MWAASCIVRKIGQLTKRTCLGRYRLGSRTLESREKLVDRQDHEEIDGRCIDHEGDEGIDEITVHELAAIYSKHEAGKIRLGKDCSDQRCNQIFDQTAHDCRKRSTDHDADCEIDDIATQNEITKSFNHMIGKVNE